MCANRLITPEEEYLDNPNGFYTREEVKRYNSSSGMKKTQRELTEIALSLSEIDFSRNKGISVLDIGCGTGFSIDYLKEKGINQVIGIDPSLEMVKLAKDKKLDVRVGGFEDLSSLGFKKDQFDLVISMSALQWVTSGKEGLFLKNSIKGIGKSIYFILKEKGSCVIQFYPRDEAVFQDVTSAFERVGFRVASYLYNEKNIKKKKSFLILKKA